MPRINSVQELVQLKEASLKKIQARMQGENIDELVQIYVGMEDTGIDSGAKELYHQIWELAQNKPVVVMQSSKLGDYKEPTVKVLNPMTKSATIFEEVTKEKAKDILEYIEQGNAVEGMITLKYE